MRLRDPKESAYLFDPFQSHNDCLVKNKDKIKTNYILLQYYMFAGQIALCILLLVLIGWWACELFFHIFFIFCQAEADYPKLDRCTCSAISNISCNSRLQSQ